MHMHAHIHTHTYIYTLTTATNVAVGPTPPLSGHGLLTPCWCMHTVPLGPLLLYLSMRKRNSGEKIHRPSPQPVPLMSPSPPFPMPRDSVRGVGCRPSKAGHRLAVTGGLSAQPSMRFCLLGASRQWRSKAPTEGAREHAVLGRHPRPEIWREMQFFSAWSPNTNSSSP